MSELTNLLDSRICPVCGKEIEILYPHLWRYKRENRYLCSWGCLRKYDEKEANGMNEKRVVRDQVETGREMVEAMERGEDPIEFLKEKGYGNPLKAYGNIVNKLREKEPELAEKIPKRREPKQKPEVTLVYDPDIEEEYRREQAQKEANRLARDEEFLKAKEEIMALPPTGRITDGGPETPVWKTTAIRSEELGEFYFDTKFRTIDWRHPFGEEISLPPEEWKRLVEELPGIMRILGVEV